MLKAPSVGRHEMLKARDAKGNLSSRYEMLKAPSVGRHQMLKAPSVGRHEMLKATSVAGWRYANGNLSRQAPDAKGNLSSRMERCIH